MQKAFKHLYKEFIRIKEKGYIKGIYNNLSSIGRTFEQELGLEMNKTSNPDYYGIELKARRAYSKSFITLFTAVPNSSEMEISRLKDTYGYPSKKDRKFKVLYAEIYGNKLNYGGAKYQYKLDIDDNSKKVYLCIYNKYNRLLERKIFWSYDYLKEKLENKLKYLAIISVWPKTVDNWNYFKYYKIDFYKLKSFNTFLTLLKEGTIKIIFKIGFYLDEKNYGRIYDHGCSFAIKHSDINELFDRYIISDN